MSQVMQVKRDFKSLLCFLFVCFQTAMKVVAFWIFILYYQGEVGSQCKALNFFYKSGSNKACCPRGEGRCAASCLGFALSPCQSQVESKASWHSPACLNVLCASLPHGSHPAGFALPWLLPSALWWKGAMLSVFAVWI